MFVSSWPARAANVSYKPQRRADRLSVASRDQDFWPTCWSQNMAITCPCIASQKSTHGKGWRWIARRWRTGGGETSRLVDPLLEALRRHVMTAQKVHADDTPVPVLAPGLGRTKI